MSTAREAFMSSWGKLRKEWVKSANHAALVAYLPSRNEIWKCIKSKRYALSHHESVEKLGGFIYITARMIELNPSHWVEFGCILADRPNA